MHDEPEESRPIYCYWWFWVFVALVAGAVAKQVGIFEPEMGEVDPGAADTSLLHAVCSAVFPCGLVWEVVRPSKGKSAAPPPATDQRY